MSSSASKAELSRLLLVADLSPEPSASPLEFPVIASIVVEPPIPGAVVGPEGATPAAAAAAASGAV